MASALAMNLLVVRGNLSHVRLDQIEAGEHRRGLLVLDFDGRDDLLQLATHRGDLFLDGAYGVLDPSGVLARVARQAADVLRHDGESFAEIAGARRLDRAVDRQHVGLDRDHADAVDDLVDVAGDAFDRADLVRLWRVASSDRVTPADKADGRADLGEHCDHPLGAIEGALRFLLRRPRRLLDLLQGGAGFLRRRGLLLGAPADLIDRHHDLAAAPDIS